MCVHQDLRHRLAVNGRLEAAQARRENAIAKHIVDPTRKIVTTKVSTHDTHIRISATRV